MGTAMVTAKGRLWLYVRAGIWGFREGNGRPSVSWTVILKLVPLGWWGPARVLGVRGHSARVGQGCWTSPEP